MARKRRNPGPAPRRPPPPRDAPYPTLDLHGETAESARRRAEGWLRGQRAAGERVVRVVTGRGLHSVGPPVLPGEIEDLLRALRGTVVESSAPEPGGGAYRVELRARPIPRLQPASPAGPLARADPELRRRAEESLAELGIHPEPTLVEAEVRRLLRERGEGR